MTKEKVKKAAQEEQETVSDLSTKETNQLVTFRNATGRRVHLNWLNTPEIIEANGTIDIPAESASSFYNYAKAFGTWVRL